MEDDSLTIVAVDEYLRDPGTSRRIRANTSSLTVDGQPRTRSLTLMVIIRRAQNYEHGTVYDLPVSPVETYDDNRGLGATTSSAT